MTNPDLAAKDVADRIRAGRNFLITSHRNPDGDALGSGLALQRLIRQLGKEARVQVRDGFNSALHNIPGANEVAVTDTLPADYPKGFDAVFTMECPEVERTGYPVLPGLFVLVAIWLLVNTLETSPLESSAGLVLILVGLVPYAYFRSHRPALTD